MIPTRLVACAICFIALAADPEAVQKTNFAGTWIIAPPSKSAGREVIVKQDDKTLTVTARRTTVHHLDGVERRQAISTRIGEVVMLSKAAWENRTVVITIATSYPNKMKTLEREIWSIDPQGRLLIELTITAEGETPQVERTLHTRKS